MSVPWSWSFAPDPTLNVRLYHRPNDWGSSRARSLALSIRGTFGLTLAVRPGDHVVLSTMGPTAVIYALAARLRRPASIHILDFLHSPRPTPWWLKRLMRSAVDHFLVIRTGDVNVLADAYGVAPQKTTFIRWPVPPPNDTVTSSRDGDYLYAAGWAHRDWDTLLEALSSYPIPAILAPGPAESIQKSLPAGTELIGMPTPEEGRALSAGARVVAVLLQDTPYAAGPLVLLDAMALGKPVIANDVSGNRDYVRAGHTALVVPPADSTALARAIENVWNNVDLRMRLGRAARTEALTTNSPATFWSALIDCVTTSSRSE